MVIELAVISSHHHSAAKDILFTTCPSSDMKKKRFCRIHVSPFHPEWLEKSPHHTQLRLPEDCKDYDQNCEGWSESGMCPPA